MLQKIKREWRGFVILLRDIPAAVVVLFVLAVFAMNLLANKSISLPVNWLALDCGIIVSWAVFLTMDIIVKHYGPKAANEISAVAIVFNLLFCLIFFVGSVIPGVWSQATEADGEAIGIALDKTFGGTWFVVLGSTVAFAASALVNNFSNWGLGKLFRRNPDGAAAYFLRTYASTALGQFVDNLVFALIVSLNFFGWNIVQCITCAVTGMMVELLCEAAFSYFGYAVCNRWKSEGVGSAYLAFINGEGESNEGSDNGQQ